jgi:hypothetical protein
MSSGPGQIIGFRAAEKAEAVVEHLDRAHPHDLGAGFGADLEDREHQLLLAQGGRALDSHFLGHGDQFGGGFLLEILEMHELCFSNVLRREAPTQCGRTPRRNRLHRQMGKTGPAHR